MLSTSRSLTGGESESAGAGGREGDGSLYASGGHIIVGPTPHCAASREEANPTRDMTPVERTKTLSLIHQGITAIRHLKDLGRLTSLRVLNLHMNRITTLTGGALQTLHQLEELDVSGNEITVLSSSDCEGLGRLQRLNLSSNQLHTLTPQCFASLSSLTWISLAFNQLHEVMALRSLPSSALLSYVDLCGNCLKGLREVENALASHRSSLTALRLRVPAYLKVPPLLSGTASEVPIFRENPFVTTVPAAAAESAPLDAWYTAHVLEQFPALTVLDDKTVAVDPLQRALSVPVAERTVCFTSARRDHPPPPLQTGQLLQRELSIPSPWKETACRPSSTTLLQPSSTTPRSSARERRTSKSDTLKSNVSASRRAVPVKPSSSARLHRSSTVGEGGGAYQHHHRHRHGSHSKSARPGVAGLNESHHTEESATHSEHSAEMRHQRRAASESPSTASPSASGETTPHVERKALPWRRKTVASRTTPRSDKVYVESLQCDVGDLKAELERHDARERVLEMQLTQQAERLHLAVADELRHRLELQQSRAALDLLKRDTEAQLHALRAELQRKGQELLVLRRQSAAEVQQQVSSTEAAWRSKLQRQREASDRRLEDERTIRTQELQEKHRTEVELWAKSAQRWEAAAHQLEDQLQSAFTSWGQREVMRHEHHKLEMEECMQRLQLVLRWLQEWMVGAPPGEARHSSPRSLSAWARDTCLVMAAVRQEAVSSTTWQERSAQEVERRRLYTEIEQLRQKVTEERLQHQAELQKLEQQIVTTLLPAPALHAVETAEEEAEADDESPQKEALTVVNSVAASGLELLNDRLRSACDVVLETQKALHQENERLLRRVQALEQAEKHSATQLEQERELYQSQLEKLTLDRDALGREVKNLKADLVRKEEALASLEEEAVEKLNAKRQRVAELEQELDSVSSRAEDATRLSVQYTTQLEVQSRLLQELQQRLNHSKSGPVSTALASVSSPMSGARLPDDPQGMLRNVDRWTAERDAMSKRLGQYEAEQQRLVEGLRFARQQLVAAVQAKEMVREEKQQATRLLELRDSEVLELRQRLQDVERRMKEKQVNTLEVLTQMIRGDLAGTP